MTLTVAAVAIPFFLTFVLIAIDMRADLSDLKPIRPTLEEGFLSIGWPQLNEIAPPQDRVRMLGYMMDGYRPVSDGTPVMVFVLQPDAGELLHPAHRIPDEMVEVWMKDGQPVRYAHRSLVLVTGTLRRVRASLTEHAASWSLTDAALQPASERDVKRWFVP